MSISAQSSTVWVLVVLISRLTVCRSTSTLGWADDGSDSDLWVTTRVTTDDEWDAPVNLGPVVNGSTNEYDPSISTDGLSLYFHSMRPGGFGYRNIWMATRPTKEDPWGTPVVLGPSVNGSSGAGWPDISGR